MEVQAISRNIRISPRKVRSFHRCRKDTEKCYGKRRKQQRHEH